MRRTTSSPSPQSSPPCCCCPAAWACAPRCLQLLKGLAQLKQLHLCTRQAGREAGRGW